jgi:hypothetical protein
MVVQDFCCLRLGWRPMLNHATEACLAIGSMPGHCVARDYQACKHGCGWVDHAVVLTA